MHNTFKIALMLTIGKIKFMKTIKILKRFKTLAAAVSYAKIKLDYNPKAQASYIEKLDNSIKDHTAFSGELIEAFVTDEINTIYNEPIIYYRYDCDIKLINKYSKGSKMITSSPFYAVTIDDDLIFIHNDTPISKSKHNRKEIARLDWIVT